MKQNQRQQLLKFENVIQHINQKAKIMKQAPKPLPLPKKMPTEKRIITTMISSALMSDKHIDEPEIGGQGTENRYNSIELSMEM